MTSEIRLYFGEAARVNLPTPNKNNHLACCTIDGHKFYNTNNIKFIAEHLSNIILSCFDGASISLERIFMRNEDNYEQHHGFKLVIETNTTDETTSRLWGILVIFFHEILEIKHPVKYIPLNIINMDFNPDDKEIIRNYIPNIFNKKPIGTKFNHPIKIELVGHNEILEVVDRWGANQNPTQPKWIETITVKGKYKGVSSQHTLTISTDEGTITIKNEAYQDNEILGIIMEYNGAPYSNPNNLLKITVKRWFNPQENKSEYEYLNAEVITYDERNDIDSNTLPLNL